MKRKLGVIITVLMALLLVSGTQAVAENVTLAIGLSLPPYVISESNTGIELDIVKEALAKAGHTVTPKYVPFGRLVKELEIKRAQGALTVNENSGIKDVHYSTSHVTYQNVAVSLKKNNIQIGKIADLAKYKVVAFQNATKYLGSEYTATVKTNSKYREVAKQVTQINLLFKGRADVVVMDINIFKFYRKLADGADTTAPVEVHEIFSATPYKVAFLDAGIRDDFDKGLAEVKSSGRYQEIIKTYVD